MKIVLQKCHVHTAKVDMFHENIVTHLLATGFDFLSTCNSVPAIVEVAIEARKEPSMRKILCMALQTLRNRTDIPKMPIVDPFGNNGRLVSNGSAIACISPQYIADIANDMPEHFADTLDSIVRACGEDIASVMAPHIIRHLIWSDVSVDEIQKVLVYLKPFVNFGDLCKYAQHVYTWPVADALKYERPDIARVLLVYATENVDNEKICCLSQNHINAIEQVSPLLVNF